MTYKSWNRTSFYQWFFTEIINFYEWFSERKPISSNRLTFVVSDIAKVRLWTAQMSFKRLKSVSVTNIYLILWIGLDLMVSSKFIKPIYLNWFTFLNLKKYESICHKCDHESVSSLHKYPKFVWLKPRKWKYQCSFVRYQIEIFEIWSWVTNLTQKLFLP